MIGLIQNIYLLGLLKGDMFLGLDFGLLTEPV
jgi:hypothetical protein